MTLTAQIEAILPDFSFLIGDRELSSVGAPTLEHHYPATGEVVGTVELAGAAQVEEAIAEARGAAAEWWSASPAFRRDCLARVADLIRSNADDLTLISMLDNGISAQGLAGIAADIFAYNAGWADKLMGEVIPTWPVRSVDYAVMEPYGVVSLIIPWNGPLMGFCTTVAPALAAGNCVVVKPSELAPYTCLKLGQLCVEAGIPAGVVNVIPGDGVAGSMLVSHAGVDKAHFTGSVSTARQVIAASAATVKPLGLELGGKSANLVFDDADLVPAVRAAVRGITALNGQACTNGTRILVQAKIYESFAGMLEDAVRGLKLTDPLVDPSGVGSVISAQARERIETAVESAAAAGHGRPVFGGEQIPNAQGYFVRPTAVIDADPDSQIAQEELFGPVATVTPFDAEADGVALANGTNYGLAAYMHTNDLRRAHRVSAELQAGMVWVNGPGALLPSIPFGGVKDSGFGRLGGADGIREFSRRKNVWIRV